MIQGSDPNVCARGAKGGRRTRLGVVEATRPVDNNIVLLVVEADRPAHGAARGDLAELEHAVEDGAVLAHVEPLELPHMLVLRGRGCRAGQNIVSAISAMRARGAARPGRGNDPRSPTQQHPWPRCSRAAAPANARRGTRVRLPGRVGAALACGDRA